jgi:hypothetical protein
MENKEPIYTAQATKIIEMMKFQTRNEVAERLNYKTWKSRGCKKGPYGDASILRIQYGRLLQALA